MNMASSVECIDGHQEIEPGENARRIDQLLNIDSAGSQAVDARQLLEEVRDDLLEREGWLDAPGALSQ